MDALLDPPARFFDMLFIEDFDAPAAVAEPAPEPEVIEPHFTASDVAAARDDAWSEGRQAGVAEANAGHAALLARSIAQVAATLGGMRGELLIHAERTGDALARALMASMAALLPEFCGDQGEAEVRAVLRALLPGLMREPAITVRVHPRLSDAVRAELARLDAIAGPDVSVVPTDALPPGDVRVDWENGTARRDTEAVWRDVRAIVTQGLAGGVAAEEREMADAG